MKTQLLRHNGTNWTIRGSKPNKPDVVLAYLSPQLPDMKASFNTLRSFFPGSIVVGCSTAGEIYEGDILKGGASGIALTFNSSTAKLVSLIQTSPKQSFQSGKTLAQKIIGDDLVGIFIISDGILVNGSSLITGLQSVLGTDVVINGGLAGDDASFGTTYVGANSDMLPGQLAIIGFYGKNLKMHSGCFAGWSDFGHERKITRSKNNVLYELNGVPALDLYKKYLGEEAVDLPASALLYPLKIYKDNTSNHAVIRSVIGIDEDTKSLSFAGDIPENYNARIMVGNADALIEGAGKSAQAMTNCDPNNSAALLVSCLGRYLALGPRAYEEANEVKSILGKIPQVGFYSYGEISAHPESGQCALHNQTMTITVLEESACTPF